MAHPPCIDGRVVLVVQRSWLIASALASAFGARGANVVLAKQSAVDSANLPNLAAAVLDGQSHELGRLLEARGIPFVLYTACDPSKGEFANAQVIEKPVRVQDVVARVEQLLS